MLKQLLTGSSIVGMLILGSVFTATQAQQQPPAPPMQETESPLPGQPEVEVNRESLQQFVIAVQQIQTIEQEAQRQMVEVVEEQGLSLDRFNEIARTQQTPDTPDEVGVSEQEIQQFNQAIEQISEIRQQAESEMANAVRQEGLEVEEFNYISQVIQQDPSLQQQVMEMIEMQN